MKKKFSYPILALLLIAALAACKKENVYIYDVNDMEVKQPDADKPNVKSTTEFISISYSDLFGDQISQGNLVNLQLAYAAFGDLKLIEEMIIKNFLNETGVQIPTQVEMAANVEQFVEDSYIKFYNRRPNEFEKWHLVNTINEDQSLTPELLWFAMMTSNEYRYY
jgi:hypothetical protein